MRPKSIGDILNKLTNVKQVKPDEWTADCPVSGHKTPVKHLHIKDAGDKAAVKCFGRDHNYKAICQALGYDSLIYGNSEKRIVATYDYPDENGKLLHQTVRYEPKDFSQRRPGNNGKWVWNLKGIGTVMYNLPEVLKGKTEGRMIVKVAGEKDCENAKRKLGIIATTNPMGEEKGHWKPEYTETLAGARLLVFIVDKDDTGRRHAQEVAPLLYGKVGSLKVLELPDRDGHQVKDPSDWLVAGGTREEFEQLVTNWPDYEPLPDTALPEIVVTDRHLRDITADALEALYKANKPEQIFKRGGVPTRIGRDENQRPHSEALEEYGFRGCLARSCNFVRITAKGYMVAVPPPLYVVRDCLKLPSAELQFPPLIGIIEAPAIRPDGTVITRPGYDSATNLYYYPSPRLIVPPIPDKPNDTDVKQAIELALEPLADFPFDTEASWVNAIATMFTPILRPMIDGLVPLTLVDKPQPGTGAGLYSDVVSLIATGQLAATMGAPQTEEEWEKKLSSQLLSGRNICVIDNVEGRLQSDTLSRYLTSPFVSIRPFHRLADLILPNKLIFLANGNNIRLAGDLPRRCVAIRMDAKMARPWLRPKGSFRHGKLREWVSENRGAILGAILTIARAWVVAGMPEASGLPNLGGYESYCRVVGGVLAHMGVTGFLANLDALYNEMDAETPQWEAFLETWHAVIGDKAVTAAEVISHINDNAELRAALPDAIADTEARNYIRRLGNVLAKKKVVRFPNGLSVTKLGEYKHAAIWQVVSPGVSLKNETHQAKLAMDGESSESGITLTR